MARRGKAAFDHYYRNKKVSTIVKSAGKTQQNIQLNFGKEITVLGGSEYNPKILI